MPNDIFKGMLFTDGEGIEDGDLNLIYRYGESRTFDQVLRAMSGNARVASPAAPTVRGAPSAAPFLYALSGGAGFITPGAGARETTVRAGTIFQQVGSPAGNEATLLPFTMADAAFTLTHAVGDATNPRIDIIEAKLEFVEGDPDTRDFEDATTEALTTTTPNKTRRVQATFQIVAGTPAASPAFPSLTAGFAALGAVLVPATHNAVFVASTHLTDLRIPLGVKSVTTYVDGMSVVDVAGDFVINEVPPAGNMLRRASMAQSLGPDSLFVPCPLNSHQRLVGIAISGLLMYSALTASLVCVDEFGAVLSTVCNLQPFLPASGTAGTRMISMIDIETAIATASGHAKNAAGVGHSLWCNGRFSGPISEENVPGSPTKDGANLVLQLLVTTGVGDVPFVTSVDWFYADGIA